MQSISILKIFDNNALKKDGEYDLKCFTISRQIEKNFQLLINNFGYFFNFF